MRDVEIPTTFEVRDVYCGRAETSGLNEDDAQAGFDLWLVNERQRVADMATERERKRIVNLFQAMIEENRKNAFDGTPGWAIWAKTIIEDSLP